MSAATANAPMVRIFAPDGNGGYIEWDKLTDSGRANVRERVYSQVRRANELKYTVRASDEHRAEVGNRVRELIGWLKEET
jgi:hypothetical protein